MWDCIAQFQAVSQSKCSLKDFPLFQYSSCESGSIGIGPNCECTQHECRLAYARQYLPMSDALQLQHERKDCRTALARRLHSYVLTHSKKAGTRGYPIDVDCSALQSSIESSISEKLPHVCTRSLGKFLRFSSIHIFNEYLSTLLKFPAFGNQFTLKDVYYSASWRPVQGVSSCNFSNSLDNGWNCLFQSVAQLPPVLEEDKVAVSDQDLQEAFKQLIQSRHNEDNVVQVLLYGLLLSIMSRPSKQVSDFTVKHLVHSDSGLKTFFDSSKDSAQTRGLSVSMHVRRGDACDYHILQEADYYKVRYLNGPWYQRPCFSVDMYMDQLRKIHARYGITTVYLATDSEEMITRAKQERGFQWVYLDFPRDVFSYQEGWWVDFYNQDDFEDISLSAAADLNLLKQGDIFLGAFSSHFSKLIFYMMAGYQQVIPPFVSMDYCLGCETTDVCSKDAIAERGTTIDHMIVRTVECMKESDDGYMHEAFDHCGLYRAGWSSRGGGSRKK